MERQWVLQLRVLQIQCVRDHKTSGMRTSTVQKEINGFVLIFPRSNRLDQSTAQQSDVHHGSRVQSEVTLCAASKDVWLFVWSPTEHDH